MAVTKGQGNPNWSKDETILALNLFFEFNQNIPGPNDEKIIELSKLLRKYPFHSIEARKSSFRNPDGVAFKLQNIRQVATGKGFGNFSKMDKLVWNEYGDKVSFVKTLAEKIRNGIEIIEKDIEIEDTDEYFKEGRIITALHKRRERSSLLRNKKIELLKKNKQIYCEICGLKPYIKDEKLIYSIFECHHIHLLSDTNETITELKDIAFLCCNCHKILHKIIVIENRWFSIQEVKEYLIVR